MDFSRVAEAKRIFQRAVELPDDDRSSYLEEACGSDLALRREVEAYLSVSTEDAARFDRGPDLATLLPGLRHEPGDRLDHYEIEALLGQGGMGVVYLARDTEHHRQVALKILLPHAARFSSREKESLARLHHPNIATLFGSGQTPDGLAYLAMEHVRGTPIDQYCVETNLGLKRRLELFEIICRAVHHAHTQLVAHRDLKPSNILVTREGTPKLLDFGVAKLLTPGDEPTLTRSNERPLTVAFSSPEQLEGRSTGTPTDVYSLGVLLCVLLSRRLPYRVKSPDDLPSAVRMRDPLAPSDLVASETGERELLFGALPSSPTKAKLRRELRGDLDAIALRALRGEAEERYASAQELAEDVRRYLEHQPVHAVKGSRRYRFRKFVQRHRIGVTASGVGLSALFTFFVLLGLQHSETARQRDLAQRQAQRAEAVTTTLVEIFENSDPLQASTEDDVPTPEISARELLDRARRTVPKQLAHEPLTQASLFSALGRIYLNLGSYSDAEELLSRTLALKREQSPEDHHAIAESLIFLGSLHTHQGRYDDAQNILTEARSLAASLVPSDNLLEARISNEFGILNRALGDLGKAVQEHSTALERFRLTPGQEQETASTLYLLGAAQAEAGDLHEALSSLKRALMVQEGLTGRAHPRVAAILNVRAGAELEIGTLSEAEDSYRSAWLIYRDTWGEKHPSTLNSMANLAVALRRSGKYSEAEELLTRALNGQRTVLGEAHPITLTTLSKLAVLLTEQGRYDEAEALHRKALELQRSVLGDRHISVARSLNNLAVLQVEQAKEEEALASFREVLAILQETLGDDHPSTLLARFNLGMTLTQSGNYDAAEEQFWLLYEGAKVALDDNEEYLGDALRGLALTEKARGEYAAAIDHAREAIRVYGQAEQISPLYIATAKRVLADSLLGAGEYQEAETVLFDAVEDLDSIGESVSGHYGDYYMVFASLYEAWGKREKAAEYRRKLEHATAN